MAEEKKSIYKVDLYIKRQEDEWGKIETYSSLRAFSSNLNEALDNIIKQLEALRHGFIK